MRKGVSLVLVIAVLLCGALPSYADSSADVQSMKSMLEGMKQQMAKMQETIEQQNLRLQQLESTKVLETSQPSVPVQAATSDKDFQKSLKDNIGEVIPWLKGAKYGGDLRLRAETFDYYDKNNDAGSTGTAADRTRNRFRFRLKWGLEKDYGDDWKLGFRISTGNLTDQTSALQTMGNPGYFTFKDLVIDRAYALYTPAALANVGFLKGVKIGAGKFENPFLRYSSPIVWDADVTPEGLYEQANLELVSTEDTKVNFQGTAGQFIVNEGTAVESDAQVYGYQGALTLSTKSFGTEKPIDFTVAGAFYDYTNWFQTVTANSNGISFLRTNTLIADNFRVLDIYPEIAFHLGSVPATLWYDYATNLANVGTENLAGSGGNDIHDADEAWGVGFKIGKPKKKGEWELFYGYYEIGANAVVAAFNDSDFGGPGQVGATNRQGHKVGFGYQLTNSVSVNWTGYIVQPLNPSTSVASSTNEDVFRSQVDFNFKF